MVILFILLPKVVYLPHNTMEFFDFTHELKVNEYDQLKPKTPITRNLMGRDSSTPNTRFFHTKDIDKTTPIFW